MRSDENTHRSQTSKLSWPRLALISALVLLIGSVQQPSYADTTIFRLGTGGSAGTYYPIGSLIANALTSSSELHSEQPYGMKELVVIAQRATGSASNVIDIADGLLEGGLAQANVVHWAYSGAGPFAEDEPRANLRGLGTLYLESMHIVVRIGSDIEQVSDLAGKRVSLAEQGSGTRLDSLIVLREFELNDNSLNAVYLNTSDAIERMRNNELDAFFIIAGYPIQQVSAVIAEGIAKVIPLSGPRVDKIIANYPFFSQNVIPVGTYDNTSEIFTIGEPAQFIVSEDLDKELVYKLTAMLWSAQTLDLLATGHPKGHEVTIDAALTGMNIPLHPGALRFYEEQGLTQ